MLEVLKFIFSGFWHWLGAAIIIAIISHGLSGMFSIRIKKNVTNDIYDDEEEK